MKVELLYFEGCPGYETLLPRLRELLAEHAPDAELELTSIDSLEEAMGHHFLGSPTVRVNGRDLEPDADARADFGMKCRLYATSEGLTRQPPDEWVVRALSH